MNKRKAISLAAVGALVLAGVAGAYETGADAGPKPPADALWQPTTHPGAYDPGDLLDLHIDDVPAPPVRVQADGTIAVPLLGDVAVAGLTGDEVAKVVADGYRTNAIMQSANILVRRTQVAGTAGSVRPGLIGPYDLVCCFPGGLELPKNPPRPVILRVDGRGELRVPYMRPVKVSGLTDGRAAAAINAAYRAAQVLQEANVQVLTLERAPADAEHKSLPDGPIEPVPEALRPLYGPR